MNLYIHKVLQILFDSTMKKKSAASSRMSIKKNNIFSLKENISKFKTRAKKKHMTMDGCNKILLRTSKINFIEHRNTYNSSPFQ